MPWIEYCYCGKRETRTRIEQGWPLLVAVVTPYCDAHFAEAWAKDEAPAPTRTIPTLPPLKQCAERD